MERVIVILLTFFATNSSMADIPALPTYQQARKLAAAAWKSAPRSIDVTYYLTIKDNTKTEEKLCRTYTELFEKEYGPDEKLSPEELERKKTDIQSNVEKELAEQQQGGRKLKYRIRCDGNSYRVDRVYGSPARTIQKGTALEQFVPGKKLDANTPYQETFIETPAPTGGFELYTYSHSSKAARIDKIERSRTSIDDRQIINVLKMPSAFILQMKLGDRKNLATEPYDVNEQKIQQLCFGALEGIRVKIRPDTNEPDEKDRIEISLYNSENIRTYTSLMICAKDDYSKVYYCQIPDPAANKSPMLKRTCSNFDTHGIPHNMTQLTYDGKGNIQLHETYKIEDVRVNIPIPKEVFAFSPPDNYVVTDYRLPEAERHAAKIESLKKVLKSKDAVGRRMKTIIDLREYLKDDPAQLREILAPVLDDENAQMRRLADVMLRQIDSNKKEE